MDQRKPFLFVSCSNDFYGVTIVFSFKYSPTGRDSSLHKMLFPDEGSRFQALNDLLYRFRPIPSVCNGILKNRIRHPSRTARCQPFAVERVLMSALAGMPFGLIALFIKPLKANIITPTANMKMLETELKNCCKCDSLPSSY